MTESQQPSAELVRWLTSRHQAVLVTLRADGSPQTSNVAVAYEHAGNRFRISVTESRAKTRNLRRDPRATLHVLGPDFGSYLSVRVHAELGEVTSSPGDPTGRDLLAAYESITGATHPDPDEFLNAMVEERRLVLTLRPVTWSGWGAPA